MNLEKFQHDDWQNFWAGSWCFTTCSYFGEQYTRDIRFADRPFIPQSIITISEGKSYGWGRTSDRQSLGELLVSQVKHDPTLPEKICKTLKTQADNIMEFMKDRKEQISPERFDKFWSHVVSYYQPHINVKYVVDYLDTASLDQYLGMFQDARLYAEPVLDNVEQFTQAYLREIADNTGYTLEQLWCLTKEDIQQYHKGMALPSQDVLKERNKGAAVVSDESGTQYYWGGDMSTIHNILKQKQDQDHVQGSTAYGGNVRGRARIIDDPASATDFHYGDILVTGMTRPDFLPLMKKAAAFVTDAGGILSHAAIVAREMKKPCVIGTIHATTMLHDGGLVEVDADNGIVRNI